MAAATSFQNRTGVLTVVVGSAGLLLLVLTLTFSSPPSCAVVAIGAATAGLVERTSLRLSPGGRASASFLVVLGTAALARPVGGGFAGLGAALGATLFTGRPLSRALFNAGSLMASGVVAGAVLSADATQFAPLALLGALAALANFGLSGLLVGCVVAADRGLATASHLLRSLVPLLPVYLGTGTVATVLTRAADAEGGVAFAVVGVLLLAGVGAFRQAVRSIARREHVSVDGEGGQLKAA